MVLQIKRKKKIWCRGGRRGGDARVLQYVNFFFTKNPNLKIWCQGGGGGGGARVSDFSFKKILVPGVGGGVEGTTVCEFFFTKNPNLKILIGGFGGDIGGGG